MFLSSTLLKCGNWRDFCPGWGSAAVKSTSRPHRSAGLPRAPRLSAGLGDAADVSEQHPDEAVPSVPSAMGRPVRRPGPLAGNAPPSPQTGPRKATRVREPPPPGSVVPELGHGRVALS